MSRKVINIVFIIGSCLYIPGFVLIIWGYASLFQNIAQQTGQTDSPNASSLNGLGLFVVLLVGGAVMVSMGGIAILVARIGAMIEIAKAQTWVWLILLMIFGWVVLLIYLLAVPKPKLAPENAAYPYPYAVPEQPRPNYQPQAPGMMPPPEQPWGNQQRAEQQYMSDRPQE